MGKPRLIILVRHAQSEGNLNRDVHQIIPDHRVKLTPEGWKQAEEAGHKLRNMLRPDDTIRIFTSPYRRTRETSEGILKTLTSDSPEYGPSPFSRSAIKVYEEPRLREQDFGNFQPCSAEMERMWRERADYGHFFYRIPNGESAADAYDRCSGFNESLWRNFSEDDFPSVCILVTHGLMTRVFLMKWYHWSVEYFEDLRNVNHCEMILMKREDNGKFALQNKLRTWSEMKRRATVSNKEKEKTKSVATPAVSSPSIPKRIWGGCVDGCNHDHSQYPRRSELSTEKTKPDSPDAQSPRGTSVMQSLTSALSQTGVSEQVLPPMRPFLEKKKQPPTPRDVQERMALPQYVLHSGSYYGRDAGGSESGMPTPVGEDFADPFDGSHRSSDQASRGPNDNAGEGSDGVPESPASRPRQPRRRATVEEMEAWKEESGMGRGTRADALGDDPDEEDEDGSDGEVKTAEEVNEEEKQDKSLRGSVY